MQSAQLLVTLLSITVGFVGETQSNLALNCGFFNMDVFGQKFGSWKGITMSPPVVVTNINDGDHLELNASCPLGSYMSVVYLYDFVDVVNVREATLICSYHGVYYIALNHSDPRYDDFEEGLPIHQVNCLGN